MSGAVENGAMCTNVRSKDGSKPYTCVCKDGWEWPDCATKHVGSAGPGTYASAAAGKDATATAASSAATIGRRRRWENN